MDAMCTMGNADLKVVEGNKSRWSHADHRRYGWHHLPRIARYGLTLRAARVLPLEKRMDLRIAEMDAVRHFTSLPWFSAMVVLQGQHVLHEQYAHDFAADRLHSIQSITKTTMHLVVGKLVDEGVIDLERQISHYIPSIGSGYATATVQEVLNMDVVNDYSEDFCDPAAMYYRHEEAMGWRLPVDSAREETERSFLADISSADTQNKSGHILYKDANTAVLAWVIEEASRRPMRAFLADIVDAAGLEETFFISSDRTGVPTVEGGACITARDLARYMSLFVRGGRGVSGEIVGSATFIDLALRSGVPMAAPFDWKKYSNHLMVSGRSVGHGGWGGQYAVAHLDTGKIAVFFSVIENEHANTSDYLGPVAKMLESIVST